MGRLSFSKSKTETWSDNASKRFYNEKSNKCDLILKGRRSSKLRIRELKQRGQKH